MKLLLCEFPEWFSDKTQADQIHQITFFVKYLEDLEEDLVWYYQARTIFPFDECFIDFSYIALDWEWRKLCLPCVRRLPLFLIFKIPPGEKSFTTFGLAIFGLAAVD